MNFLIPKKLPNTLSWFLNTIYQFFFFLKGTQLSLLVTSIGEGNGIPLQYSCLESPMDGGAWWAAVYGISQSRTWLKRLSSSSSYKHNLKDIVGLVSDHHNKANIAMKWVNFFGFPVHMKVMFTLYCSLFSVQ